MTHRIIFKDLSGETVAAKPKRAKTVSPTQRTLQQLRKDGWVCHVAERWNPFAKIRQDAFGIIDILAIGGGHILAVQACAGASHAARRDKIVAEPRARIWLESGGRLEIWSWAKQGARGAVKKWTCRIEQISIEQLLKEQP